jgi:Amt family ammonium transporter
MNTRLGSRRRGAAADQPEQSYFDNCIDAVAQVDVTGRIVRVNRRMLDDTGFPTEALVGRSFAEICTQAHQSNIESILSAIPKGGRSSVEAKIRNAGGRTRDVEIHCVPVFDTASPKKAVGAYVIPRDLSDRKRVERELESRALHDYLTGLPNRVLFADRLRHGLDSALRREGLLALLYIDLDRFKPINDREGHSVGDEVLRLVASRLNASVRAGDSVARLGGDEFGIIMENLESRDEATAAATRILSAIRAPAEVEGKDLQVGASIGVAFSDVETESPEALVGQADLAMYEAKRRGGFSVEVFRPELDEMEAHNRLQLEADLRKAIRRNELSLQYQPIVDARSMKVVAFEVLVRWAHPELGPLLPSTFIPIAEESSLIAELDRWVLSRACTDVMGLIRSDEYDDSVYLSVNLSGRHFEEADIVDAVSSIILETGFDPDILQLELTESVAGGDPSKMRRLRALGVKLAIDDFGTGYSSLSYVRDLDVDVLKVDKSFVLGLGADPSAVAIVRTIITLADMLSLGVIVEGVEDSHQLEKIVSLGGQIIQGYLFGRAMDLEAVPGFLRDELKLPNPQETASDLGHQTGRQNDDSPPLGVPNARPQGGKTNVRPYQAI